MVFVYLDESGDAGFKFRQGSSRYFVVALLLVDDPIPIQVAIDDLRRSLGFAPRDEFKFNHASEEVRRRFLRELRRQSMSIRALVVDKWSLTQPQLRDQATFYDQMVKLVLTEASGSMANATLVLDESVKSKRRKRTRGSFLRQALNLDPAAPKLRRIIHHASHTDSLIQAADMVSGAVYARFHHGDASYLEIIRTKIEHLRVLGPETL